MGENTPREILHVDRKAAEVPFDAGQIEAGFGDLVLLEMKNVAVRAVDKVRECGVQTLAIRALHAQDGAIVHGHLSSGPGIVLKKYAFSVASRSDCQSA